MEMFNMTMIEATPSYSDRLRALLNREPGLMEEIQEAFCNSGNCPQCGAYHKCMSCTVTCSCGHDLVH